MSHTHGISRSSSITEDAAVRGGSPAALVELERLLPTKPLLLDLCLWQYTRNLRRVFVHLGNGPMQRSRAKDQLEAKNILDRWLLSFQLDHRLDSASMMSRNSLPLLPRPGQLSLANGASQKLVAECLEKQFSSDRRNAERIAQAMIDAVDMMESKAASRVEQLARDPAGCTVSYWERRSSGSSKVEGQLRIGSPMLYESPCCPRLHFLVRNFGLYNTARMMLRYETLGTGSLQWGDPVTVHQTLYRRMGVRYEGFASPLNSKLLGMPGAGFCSLFRDTDAPFGSLGEFFAINFADHPGGWTVNPPFIEELMGRVADKLVQHLDRDGVTNNWFFVTFPAWTDCPGWQTLASSRHKQYQLDLLPHLFTVQDSYGSVFRPKNALTIFLVGQAPSNDALDHDAVREAFLNVDVASVETAWQRHCCSSAAKAN